jgi:AcrR family transcriptional regulator
MSADRRGADRWFREPQQERSQETLDRLLDALVELLGEREFDDISVSDIARRAERTVGSFYGRFPDKEAALYALHTRHLERDRAAVATLFQPERFVAASLSETVHSLVSVVVGAYRHPRASFRAVILRSASAPEFLDQCAETARFVGDAWTRVLVSKRFLFCAEDPERIARLCFRHVLAVLNQDLLFGGLVPPLHQSEAELVTDLTETSLLMLGAVPVRSER